MRTKEVEIAGGKHMLVFNNRVLAQLEAKGIKLGELQKDKPITHIMELLVMMSEAGARYAQLEHLGEYAPIRMDDLLDTTGPEEYSTVQTIIAEVMTGVRNVEATPGKNAESGPAEGRGN